MSPYASAARAQNTGHDPAANNRELKSTRQAPYLRAPDRLLRAYAHDPLAVGVYLAVARCAVAHQGPVPLSAADLAAWVWIPRERDANVMRRLKRLLDDGWLVAEAELGTKRRLCPTWGRDANGTARPWDWQAPQLGKPEAVRTRRVPTDLLDTYLGRLDPQPGRRPATITRYFDRPLLDLADIGAYALCTLVVAEPTLRLRRLGLFAGGGPVAPYKPAELLQKAARCMLLITEDETIVLVLPSPAGWRKLGYDVQPQTATDPSGSRRGSRRGSDSGQQGISNEPLHQVDFSASESEREHLPDDAPAHTWESWESWGESTNPPPPYAHGAGGGGTVVNLLSAESHTAILPAMPELDPAVQTGHQVLNPNRLISPGEWFELCQLQRAYGCERLLIWQARATRVERNRARGIVPAYYDACAADEACAGSGQRQQSPEVCVSVRAESATVPPAAPQPAPVELARPAVPPLDPACDALLQAMGVRRRSALAGVTYELIAAWHEVVQHPGMAARFADPVAFAVSQLAAHVAPPTPTELGRWAAWQSQSNRNVPPQLIEPSELLPAAEEAAWLSHAHALLPNASADDLALLTSFLVQGATDDEALALLQAQRSYEAQCTDQEVCV